MTFSMTHRFFTGSISPVEVFDEDTAPDWLTGINTRKGSTMDCRWFWVDYILKLEVGESRFTDFRKITRIS